MHVHGDARSLEGRCTEPRELCADVLLLRLDGRLGGEGARDGHAAPRRIRQSERETVRRDTPHDVNGHATLSRWFSKNGLESTVDVAIEQRARLDGRHACSDDAPTLSSVHSEAFELASRVEEDHSVAVVERLCAVYEKSATATRTGASERFAYGFRRVERGNVGRAPMEKIVCEDTVEALLRPWYERVGGASVGDPSK